MKFPRFILAVACVAFASTTIAGTCTGSDPCYACKTCNYCKHCAKEGGTCGVKKSQ
jgi:hypothetical protein